MRQAGQIKFGFYPAPTEAITAICRRLAPVEDPESVFLFDPCAGEGLAIRQIADHLGVPHDHVHCCELDETRAGAVRANLPGVILPCPGPSAFETINVRPHGSFGLVYANPPFDDELGGGRREEFTFIWRCTHLLCDGGIGAYVFPYGALAGKTNFINHLDAWYEDATLALFPDAHRKFRELVFLGRKRKNAVPEDKLHSVGLLNRMGFHYKTYGWDVELARIDRDTDYIVLNGYRGKPKPWREPLEVPPCWKPSRFEKKSYTAEEKVAAVNESPLGAVLKRKSLNRRNVRPPMPPGRGHIAMLLASGRLNGVVDCPEGPLHVVRGTAKKVWYANAAASKSVENPDTGALRTTDVESQKIVLIIRTVGPEGLIATYGDESEEEAGALDEDTEED